MIEMRDALSDWNITVKADSLSSAHFQDPNQVILDAMSALTALGYKPIEAKTAISKVHQSTHNNEQLIRLALQQMARK